MKKLPRPCVLDASAGIKMFLREQESQEVRQFIAEALQDEKISVFVPDLFFAECANVLWKGVRRGEYTANTARRNLSDLRQMDLPSTPSVDLMERALQLACQCGISAYDGCYAALAELRDIPLLTADQRLVGLLANTGIKVVSLGASSAGSGGASPSH